MSNVYFGLAVLGAVAPQVFLVQRFAAQGLGLGAFAQGLFANGAAAGCSADVLISSEVFWLFPPDKQDNPPALNGAY